MASGLAIENACAAFDAAYAWPGGAGEPGRPNGGNRGLRDLWAYFIDVYLERLETRAATWAADAQRDIVNNFPGPESTSWVNAFFGPNGVGSQLQFSQPNPGAAVGRTAGRPVAASKYGMWNTQSGPW